MYHMYIFKHKEVPVRSCHMVKDAIIACFHKHYRSFFFIIC